MCVWCVCVGVCVWGVCVCGVCVCVSVCGVCVSVGVVCVCVCQIRAEILDSVRTLWKVLLVLMRLVTIRK